jgi:hypothetical protein
MRRLFIICLLALSATALLVSAPAASAAKAKKPAITRVTPMRISVGNVLTIRGRNFKPKRTQNTVIFRSASGRTAFAKPRRASRKKLVVVVPAAVARLLNVAGGRQRPTRLKLRVLAGTFSRYTTRRLSPVVTAVGEGDGRPGGGGTGGGGGAGTVVCNKSADHDNDLLGNDFEKQIGTDPCLEDTDGDTMTDGWEYYAAKDLNIKAVPYPGQRPFPNALDPSDGADGAHQGGWSAWDFDGDGLTTLEEYRAWRITGSSVNAAEASGPWGDHESPLGYSDGTKTSRPGPENTPATPAWMSPAYGGPAPAQAFPATYNIHGDGVYPGSSNDVWRDDERDADADGLANWLEAARGPGKASWWAGFYGQEGTKAEPWPKDNCGQEQGAFTARPFAELDLADPDVDGDTLLDGEDDQDNDDVINIRELYEATYDLDGSGVASCSGNIYPAIDMDPGVGIDPWAVNAYNPCAPDPNSRTCQDYKPFG